MAVENLKSLPITNLDTAPPIQNTSGEGGPGYLRHASSFITITAAASITSTYRMIRLPSNAKLKQVLFESEAQGAGTLDISVYYSDAPNDGTAPANSGLVVPTTGAAFIASIISVASAVAQSLQTNESGNYTLAKRNQPLWQALGLTADPGGYLDLVLVVTGTAITTGTGRVGLEAHYVM